MALRLAIGLALIGLLLWADLLDLDVLAGALRHPLWLLGALPVLFGTLLVAALRWHVLLRIQDIRLPGKSTLRVVLASSFFSAFLPGALGGELLRSGYMLRAAHGRASTGLLSILMDRVLGLAGLLVVSAIVALAHPRHIPAPIGAALLITVLVLILGAYALPRITKLLARRVPPSARSWRATLSKSMRELNTAIATYRRAQRAIATGLLLSMVICVLDVIGLLLVMHAMGIDALPWMQQALACTLALMANNLPFTPGGLGIGEAAFANVALILEPVHTGAPYATAFLAYRCITILSTLPGAFVGIHLPPRRRARVPAHESPR
ncbi:MAG: lysylphosphatidylglycerol synthase transmembrane domain-containing protein [Rhodospirillaceae bacterium]